MKIYCQGHILPEEEATVSAGDHGFLYGASLFETFRTYHGKPFLLQEHMERLRAGSDAFGISLRKDLLAGDPPDYPLLRSTIRDLLARNDLQDAVFRYTLSAGSTPPGLPKKPFEDATEILFVRPLPSPVSEAAIHLHILNTPRTEPEVLPRPKSAQYMNSLIASRELAGRAAAPGDEGLMLTRDGRLSEGVTTNVFLVRDGCLATPSPAAHILSGITRNKVLDLAAKLSLEACEQDLDIGRVADADAIFVTNSVRGIVPVNEVYDKARNSLWRKNSAENELLRRLSTAYEALLPCSAL